MSDIGPDYDTRDSGRIGAAVIDMIRGAIGRDNNLLKKAADSIDMAVTYGNLPRRDEFVGTLYAALSYDILNERHKANNMYERIQHTMLPDLSHITLSRKLSEQLGRGMGDVGLRKTREFGDAFGAVRNHLNKISSEPGHLKIQDESMDDYTVLFSTLSVLDRFFTSIRAMDKDSMDEIRGESARILKDLDRFDPQPWMEVYSMLCMHLIRHVCDRAITNLEIPHEIKMNLARTGRTELWDSQQEAIRSGLLEGHNLLYLSQPGTGKSFMAYLAAGRLAGGKQMAYLVPLKSLAFQVHTDLGHVLGPNYAIALSDRDNTAYDADMGSQNVIVATYEKMDALIRNGSVYPERVQTVIVDEAHNIGDSTRGMAIEMMLGRMMSCGSGTQLVLLSGLISDNSSKDLAEWIDAKPVRRSGQDENGTDEMIYCDGMLHHRSGEIERLPLNLGINTTSSQKRRNVTAHFARQAIAQGEPMLVSVNKRTYAAELASWLKENVKQSAFFESDMNDGLERHKVEYHDAAERIKSMEPRPPKFATELAEMLDYGIAYHHAKLPARYREVIEDAIRRKEIHVVIATPTFEAGVNLPLKTILFFEPRRYDAAANNKIPIETSRYVNLAGRTGRPGYYPNGSVVVVAMTASEMEDYRKTFWESEPEDIQSSFSTAVDGNEAATSALESQLLGYVTAHNGGVSMDEIMKQISSTWYGRHLGGNRITDVRHLVMERLRKLVRYGFLISEDEPFEATMLGKAVGVSMLLPSSMFNMINVMKHMRLWERGGHNLTDNILILAGLAEEVLVDKKAVEKIRVPDAIRSAVDDIFKTCDMTGFRHNKNSVMSIASCLHYWTESHQTEEIIGMCGEDAHQQSEAGLIEEGITQEAHRVLVAMAGMMDHMEQGGCTSEAIDMLRKAMMETAEFCKYGSNDNIVLRMLMSSATHMGRSSAIAVARHLQDSNKKEVGELTKEEFVGIFPDNTKMAASLYDEITMRS